MSNNSSNNNNQADVETLDVYDFYKLFGNTVNDPQVTEEIRYQNIKKRLLNELHCKQYGHSKYVLEEIKP